MITRVHAPALRLSVARLTLWTLVLIGLLIAGLRLTSGIGGISNMNNAYSFGFWIGHKLSGVAMAAGAFTVCAAVYIFNLKEFRPLLKPAILTGLLGYLMFITILVLDLGRPERIWHLLIFWNTHSPLFEVGMCVMAYSTVLILEFSPVIFDKLGWERPSRWVHKITLPLVILGVVLSTLHQSSLGSLFIVGSDRVRPLWHGAMIPVFFFISAVAAGLCMLILEPYIRSRVYAQELPMHLLSKLARAIPWVLAVYLAAKIGELIYTGELGLLFQWDLYTGLFWAELLVGVTLPMILLSFRSVRERLPGLLTGIFLVLGGVILNRFNVGLVAWYRPAGMSYTPHAMEIALTLGVIAAGLLAYDWVARNLPLFTDDHQAGEVH